MNQGEEPGVFGMTVCCNVGLVCVCLEPALEKSIENRNGSVLSFTCFRLSFWRILQAERSTGYRQYSSGQQTSWNPLRTRGVPLHHIETVMGFGRVEVPGDQHIRTLTSYAGASWIWICDLDSGWSCQVLFKWLWRSQAGRTKIGWSHVDSLDQWFSNLEALGPFTVLKKLLKMSKGFCLCGFYWYLPHWKLKLRNVLNVLFNLFKVTMMNPLHVNISNAYFMKNNYISQSKIKKWKECHCFTFLHISLTSGLRTARFLFVLMHSIYYDMLLCLKYIKTIYEVYTYK